MLLRKNHRLTLACRGLASMLAVPEPGLWRDTEQHPRLSPAASPPALPQEVDHGGRVEPLSINPPHLWGWRRSQGRPPGPTQVQGGSRCQPCSGKGPDEQTPAHGEHKTLLVFPERGHYLPPAWPWLRESWAARAQPPARPAAMLRGARAFARSS